MSTPLNSVLPSQFGATEAAPPPTARGWQAWLRALHAAGVRPWPVLGALLLLATLGGAALHFQGRASAAAEQAETAQRSLALLAELRATAESAEAAQRGHALTGDVATLQPLQRLMPRAQALLEELRALVSHDPAQYSRLIALAPLLTQRSDQLASAADARQRGGTAGLAAAVAAADDRRVLQQMQVALAELQASAQATLATARDGAASAASRANLLVLLATVAAMAVSAVALLQGQITAARLAKLRADRRSHHEGQQRLRQLHTRLLESSLAPICLVDREGRIRRANPAAVKLWAGDATQLVGTPLADHAAPEDRRKTEKALEAATQGPQQWQHRWRRADGSWLHLRWSARQALDDGTLVCVAHDDTEAHTLAETLARQAGALQQGEQALAEAAQRAGTAEGRLGEFLSTLSRCLRPPLATLLQQAGNAQQGLHGTQEPKATAAWAQVLERTRGLQDAVEHVLLLGRMEAGQIELKPEAFDVWDTLNRSAALVQGPADRLGLRLRVQLADDLGYAHGDTRRVEQALLHVLQEAVGSAAGGEMTVSARRSAEGLIHVEVGHQRAEGGATSLDELLAPLHDPDKPASAEQLTRLLGVAMARTLLRQMGGSLTAGPQAGRGCVFELTLPADQLPQK